MTRNSKDSRLESAPAKKRFSIPIRHLFDVPVNCRLRIGRFLMRSGTTKTHSLLLRLFNSAIWPKRIIHWTVESVNHVSPVQSPVDRVTGQFFSAKLGRAVKYRSTRGRQFLRKLERAHSVLWYVENPVSVPFCEGSKAFVHVPDVLVWLRDQRVVLCQLKDASEMKELLESPRWSALENYSEDAGWGLLLTDGEFSFTELEKHRSRIPEDGNFSKKDLAAIAFHSNVDD